MTLYINYTSMKNFFSNKRILAFIEYICSSGEHFTHTHDYLRKDTLCDNNKIGEFSQIKDKHG